MGSNTSKPNNGSFQIQKNESELGNNPDDPRSPTPEIVRTPLNGKPGGKHNITKNADLRKTFENAIGDEKLIHNNPILSAVIRNHLQSYDPRSPTQEFERTPIVISNKVEELNDKTGNNYQRSHLYNNNPEIDSCDEVKESPNIVPKNLCNGFYDMTLDDSIKETEEPLGSSTASNEAIEECMVDETTKKPTELLETNFEFVDCKTECDKLENSLDNTREGIQENKIDMIPRLKILENDPRSPSIDIERTPIVVGKVEEDLAEENVEEMSDDSLIKVLQSTNAELRQTANRQEQNQEGLMIYEDETDNINETPKKSTSINNGARTPLSCMKNKADGAHARSKSANTLYDPKKHKIITIEKSPKKHVSQIPRLKSLSKVASMVPSSSSISLKSMTKGSAVSGDCENTPPNSHRDRWDKDTSIVL